MIGSIHYVIHGKLHDSLSMLIKSRHCGIAISSKLLFREAAVVHTTVVSTNLLISLREISKRFTRALTIFRYLQVTRRPGNAKDWRTEAAKKVF